MRCAIKISRQSRLHGLLFLSAVVVAACGAGKQLPQASQPGQCPGYITRDEAIRIAEDYARREGLTWMQEETHAIWVAPSWLLIFDAPPAGPDGNTHLGVSEDGIITFCMQGNSHCAPPFDRSFAPCRTPVEERISEDRAIALAIAHLKEVGIVVGEMQKPIFHHDEPVWHVGFLGSLAIGDHFSVVVSPEGEVLRLVGGN